VSGRLATPSAFVDRLLENSVHSTANMRQFMEAHPRDRQPKEPTNVYTGKLDHTTCVSFYVADYSSFRTIGEVKEIITKKGRVSFANKNQERSQFVKLLLLNSSIGFASKKERFLVDPLPLNLVWVLDDVDQNSKGKGFVVVGPFVRWNFVAESIEEKESWIRSIEEAVKLNCPEIEPKSPKRTASYKFEELGTYHGDWELGEFHGKGVFTDLENRRFEGDWHRDLKAGFGRVTKTDEHPIICGWINRISSHGVVELVDVEDRLIKPELSKEDWEILLANSIQREFRDSEAILKRGEINSQLFRIINGRAKVVKSLNGENKQIGILTRTQMFGEMSVLDPTSLASASVIAEGPVSVACISLDLVRELFRLKPTFSRRFHHVLALNLVKRLMSVEGRDETQRSNSAVSLGVPKEERKNEFRDLFELKNEICLKDFLCSFKKNVGLTTKVKKVCAGCALV
jgi:hypothetical protein